MIGAEPRSMTVVDLVALVLGVALAFAAVPETGAVVYIFRPPVFVIIYQYFMFLAKGLALTAAVVALGRSASYRRTPHAPEWLAVLATAATLSGWPALNLDGGVNAVYATFPSSRDSSVDFGGWRWILAGGELAGVAAGLGLLRLGRRILPRWLAALALAGLASVAIAGPLFVLGLQGADLISPSAGFGPGELAVLHRKAYELIMQIPLGMLFGVPAIAALGERFGSPPRPWTWVDRASMVVATVLGLLAAFGYRNEFDAPSWAWLGERLMLLAWFVVVALASRMVLRAWRPPVS